MKYMFFKLDKKSKEFSHNNVKNTTNSCKIIDLKQYIDKKNDDMDDEITKFFFDSVHKNYLHNK